MKRVPGNVIRGGYVTCYVGHSEMNIHTYFSFTGMQPFKRKTSYKS